MWKIDVFFDSRHRKPPASVAALALKSSAGRDGQILRGARPGDLQPSSAADGFPFAVWVAKPLGCTSC
jgi:hypothetical protein